MGHGAIPLRRVQFGLPRTPRKGNGGLKGVTAGFALPKMARPALIDVFRPFRHEQLFAALGAFNHRTWGSNVWTDAIGLKRHGTFLTRLHALYARRFLNPIPTFNCQTLSGIVKQNRLGAFPPRPCTTCGNCGHFARTDRSCRLQSFSGTR
jgi:hypothetical protein